MPVSTPRGEGAALTIIAAGTIVTGDITTEGVVKVEGQVTGNIQARQQVLVARGGVVEGNIETGQAIIGGAVNGDVAARDRVEIQGSAVVAGDLTAQRLVVLEGGRLNGALQMRPQGEPDPAP